MKTYEDLYNTYGDHCTPYATVTNWIPLFKRSKVSVENDLRIISNRRIQLF